jgi:hypothetical protein
VGRTLPAVAHSAGRATVPAARRVRRGGRALWSLLAVLPVIVSAGGAPLVAGPHPVVGGRHGAMAPPPRFRLAPTYRARLATGWVELSPAPSPFGIAASRDGRIVYDLDIAVNNLPPASSLGPYSTYEAWLATPKLDLVRDLGAVQNGTTLRGQADWNKFTVLVTAEAPPIRQKWNGAVVLVGRSPSSLMQSFAGHPFYNTGQAPY